MIRKFFVWFGGLVTMALICWAAVILHAIGGYRIEITPALAAGFAAGIVALFCHEFGYRAGRDKALDDRFYPDADAPYVHFPRGMNSYRARLEFLNRAIQRLHEIESAKADHPQKQGADSQESGAASSGND